MEKSQIRTNTTVPPKGKELLEWYGPGLLWMLSSVGSGSVLFTPRIGARYGYEMLWIALIVIFFQWVMIREVGRYTVATGRTLLDGFGRIPGPKGWAIWFIVLPQIVAAVVTIAGISALAGSALMIAFPGTLVFYAPALIIVSIIMVLTGQYQGIEKITSFLAILLSLSAIVSAFVSFPKIGSLASGAIPGLPSDFDAYFVLPWVGFILAGAAGIIWFSYWVAARGFGGKVTDEGEGPSPSDHDLDEEENIRRLKTWTGVMTQTALIGILSGGLVILSFLVLGVEILQPEGLVPQGIQVAEDLTRLLSEIWGMAGKWIILIGIMIALWGTILADQDGWGRMFADATLLLRPKMTTSREKLKNFYAVTFTAVLPLIVFFIMRNPVDILSIGGIVAAAHTPVIVAFILYLNRKTLPRPLQPGWFITLSAALAGLFFAAFAVIHFANMMGIKLIPESGI